MKARAKVTPDEVSALVGEVYSIQVSHCDRSLTKSINSGILLKLKRKGLISLDAEVVKPNYFIRHAHSGSPVFIDNGGRELTFHDLTLAKACGDLYHQRYLGSGHAPKVIEEK